MDRALQILEILAREGDAGVSEIAEEMGIHKSTVSRLVGSLVGRELVRQNSERGKYQLGFGILRLASSIPGRLSVVHEAREILESLARNTRKRSTWPSCDRTMTSTWTRPWARQRWLRTTGSAA